MKQKETQLQKAIVEYLTIHGIFCWVNKTGGTYDPTKRIFRSGTTTKGIADILGILPGGKFLAIEVKIKPNKLSPEQGIFIEAIKARGGNAIVMYSIDDAIEWLKSREDKSVCF